MKMNIKNIQVKIHINYNEKTSQLNKYKRFNKANIPLKFTKRKFPVSDFRLFRNRLNFTLSPNFKLRKDDEEGQLLEWNTKIGKFVFCNRTRNTYNNFA